jgi:hypothetical protein
VEVVERGIGRGGCGDPESGIHPAIPPAFAFYLVEPFNLMEAFWRLCSTFGF